MMSSSSQANQPKSSSNDTDTSFVDQMATTVTRLFPNTVTNWFNTIQNTNGSTQTTESTDSSTEDESTDGPLQPPAKQMRYNLPGPSSLYTVPETKTVSTNTESRELDDHMANRSIYNLEPNLSTNTCEDTSAMLNQIEKSHYNLHDTSSSSSHLSSSRKRKSLDTNANLSQLNESYGKPFFRKGLAASSSFYRGNSKYGGTNNSCLNQPNIKSKITTHINNTMNENEATMSNDTKNIMDLLDNVSYPTVEAGKSPQTTDTSMNNSNKSTSSSTASKKCMALKNKEIYVPRVGNVIKLRQRSRLMKATRIARHIIDSQSSSDGISNKIGPINRNKSGGKYVSKIRSRPTKANKKLMEKEHTVPAANVPTATLQIDKDKSPTFSFNISLPSHPNHENQIPSLKQPEPNKKKIELSSSDSNVVVVVEISTEKHNSIVASDTHESTDSNFFNFSYPVHIYDNIAKRSKRNVESIKSKFEQNKRQNLTQTIETATIQLAKEQENKCKDIKKCIECEIQLNQEQVQSDKCPDCEKVKQPEPLKIVVSAMKWRCADCWVDNDEEKDKCVCCGGKKPSENNTIDASNEKKDKDEQKNKTSVVNDLSHIVKQQSSKWQCQNCLISNENNISKCVCCESENPGTMKEVEYKSFNFGMNPNVFFEFGIDSMQNIPLTETVTANSMASQDKQSETNNNVFFGNKFEFKSAETKSTEATAKPAEINKESSDAPKTTFSYGIPKDNPVITFAPTSSTPTSFSFCKSKPLDEPNTENYDKPKVTPEKGLFDIKPTSNISSWTTNNTLSNLDNPFTMTQINNSTTTESVALQNTFTISSNNFIPPPADLFNKAKSATATETTTILRCPIISSANLPSSSMTFFSNSITAGGSQQNAFFKKNETETSATLSLFPKSDSTTALFPKPESTTTTSLSLFLKPKSTIITAAATQPLASNSFFSFGSNASQNTQQPAEKPKFPFTFGSNTSDTSKLFSAPLPFGSAVDKFNMSYPGTIGSSLSSNNGIGNSPMNNTMMNTNTINNSVMTSNALGNNAMTSSPIIGGNIMGNNTMGTNAVGGSTTHNNNILSNISMNNNEMSNNNGLTTGNHLAGLACGNGLAAGTGIGGKPSGLSNILNSVNPLMVGSSSTSAIGGNNIFNRVQKKDMWSGSYASGCNRGNIFASSATTSTMQNPSPFTFGGATSFNATLQPQLAHPAQGPSQPASNMFGSTLSNQPLFTNTVPNHPAQPNVFGSPQPAAPSTGLFGASGFCTPSATFENVEMNSTQAPAFNFGVSNNQPNVFGFSQRPQMPQASGVYNFGSPAGTSTPQVQFNMGSAPAAGRRVRKVIRRTTAR